METFQEVMQDQRVFLTAEKEVEEPAYILLSYLKDLLDEVTETAVVEFHYAYIGFKKVGGGYQIVFPDLERDPEKKIEDGTYFLKIIHSTFQMANQTNTQGKNINFTYMQDVIVANNTFTEDEFYMHRYAEDTWFIGPVNQNLERQPLQGFKAYQLLPQHPECYQVLHLPTDYIALFSKGKLISVLNIEGKDVLNDVNES